LSAEEEVALVELVTVQALLTTQVVVEKVVSTLQKLLHMPQELLQ
jgi:hypothetical protein